jgi:pimeloyl-ACP methyl ester carboxylesterase
MFRHGLIIALACVWLGGCGGSGAQPFVSDERLDRGYVLVFTGIEGRSMFNQDICAGLAEGGVDYAIELVDWTNHIPGMFLFNERAETRNRRKADEVAYKIMRYKMAHPGRPVILLGQSGGGAVAAWTAEAMPYRNGVDGVIMMAASLSPEYPLDMALANSKRGIINFYSSKDFLLLGAGTWITGTMDGEHTSSAGRKGFKAPTEPTRAFWYSHLYQFPWREEWEQTGYTGSHLSSGARSFFAFYVAPMVLSPTWDTSGLEATLDRMPVRRSPAKPPAKTVPDEP